MPVRLNGSTSGYVELAAPAVAGTTSLELPTDSIKPGLVLVAVQSFSAVSSVSVNNCFTATYENYRVMVSVTQASGTQDIPVYMKLRASGADNSVGYYIANGVGISDTAQNFANSSSNVSTGFYVARLANSVDNTTSFSLELHGPQLSKRTPMYGTGMWTSGNSNAVTAVGTTIAGLHNTIASYDGFSLSSTANLTGTLRVYGYRNSL